jgi:hypothetical protein
MLCSLRIRALTALGAALGTMLASTASHAQDKGDAFGEQGQFIFGADRLFSVFAYTSNIYSFPGVNGNSTTNGTEMGLFWGGNGIAGGTAAAGAFGAGNPNFYSPPRLGFDYTVIPHLTIGGELFVWFTPGQNNTTPAGNGTSVTNPSPTGNEFGIAPRVGYIIGVNDVLGVWLRGGVSYYLANWSSNAQNGCSSSASLDVFGLDLDPQLVISPVRHFAFAVGPALDWGFLGGWSSQATCNAASVSGNYNAVNFSINGGMVGWF